MVMFDVFVQVVVVVVDLVVVRVDRSLSAGEPEREGVPGKIVSAILCRKDRKVDDILRLFIYINVYLYVNAS